MGITKKHINTNMIDKLIKWMLKFAWFKDAVAKQVFILGKTVYVDRDENAILNYVFSDASGRKYFKYIRPDLLPIQRYEQMDIRLMEIQSRISRESLKLFAETNESAARANDMLTVARLSAELNERLEILYDPEVMMRFICGLLIREDQVKTTHIWNQEFENQKYKDLISEFDGRLSFFFQLTSLSDHVSFSTSSDTDSENTTQKILNEPMIQAALKEVQAFDQMLMKVSQALKSK